MFLPVSSVNSSITPTTGALTFTSAEVCVVTLIYVLTVKLLPPQLPARLGCNGSKRISSTAVPGLPTGCGKVDDAVPAFAATPAVAQQRATIPVQALSAAMTIRKR